MKTSELSVTDARINLSRIVRAANNDGEVTYLTSNGLRVAAIVPLTIAPATATAAVAVGTVAPGAGAPAHTGPDAG